MADTDACYVVLAEVGACAARVVTGTEKKGTSKFLAENAGRDIATVTVAEAREMLLAYIRHKRSKK